MLTNKQKKVLNAIEYLIEEKGYSPTYQEIANLLNVRNVSNIFNIVMNLEKKGYVSTKQGKSRTIMIVRECEQSKFATD
ncbi:MAG: transcriptional regulator [Bacilli bacterium]|nr:transcriptional regulator [Bacilli bacterium]